MNPTSELWFDFTIDNFTPEDGHCLLNVQIPSGQEIVFNIYITDEKRDWFNGDKYQEQIYLNGQRNRITITNVTREFGNRDGLYLINGDEVYGIPYASNEVNLTAHER